MPAKTEAELGLGVFRALFGLSFLLVGDVLLVDDEGPVAGPSSLAKVSPLALLFPFSLPFGIRVADTSRSESLSATFTRERFDVEGLFPREVGLGICCDAWRFFVLGLSRLRSVVTLDLGEIATALPLPKGCGVIGVDLAPILPLEFGVGIILEFEGKGNSGKIAPGLALAAAVFVVSFELLSARLARLDPPFLPYVVIPGRVRARAIDEPTFERRKGPLEDESTGESSSDESSLSSTPAGTEVCRPLTHSSSSLNDVRSESSSVCLSRSPLEAGATGEAGSAAPIAANR